MTARQAKTFVLVAAVIPVLAVRCLPGSCDEPGPNERMGLPEVDKLFAKWNRPDTPGCAVGIVQNGKPIYRKGFGSANLDGQVPNTPQTVFETASFAKSLGCACLALLMDEGKIAPEDDLRKFVPEMHAFDPPIRIQDMVRCRSGLWDSISIPILIGWENVPLQTPYTEADFFSLITGQKSLPFKPGSEFRYSSGDYFLLGTIIKRVSGQSVAEFARKRIFEPLEMKRTFYEEEPTRVAVQRAVGHYKPKGDAWHIWRSTAGGGPLVTCVDDLYLWDRNFTRNRLPRGKYLDAFLRDGELLGNRYVLDVDAYIKETNPEAKHESPAGQYRGLRRRQFTGGAWGVSIAMSQFPDQELTVICLSNSDQITAWTMTRRIADLLLADHLKPLPRSEKVVPLKDQPTADVKEADLRDKVGAYRLLKTGQIWQIKLENGKLKLTDHLLATHNLRPLSATRFDPDGPFYASTQFVFSQKPGEKRPSFVSEWDEPGNRGRLEFERVEMVNPNAAQLAEYTGEYVSDELAATYRLALRETHLWLRVNSRRWEQLDATVRDEFVPHLRDSGDGRLFRFLRNDKGNITAIAAEFFRVTGVRFVKRIEKAGN